MTIKLQSNNDGTGTILVGATEAIEIATNGTVSLLLVEYANDGAAATGGVPVGGLYKTSGAVKVRVT